MSTKVESSLEGVRYVALARCSTVGQADTSIDDQLKAIHAFGERHGMVAVDEIRLEGFSGSLPSGRTDIAELIHRKETQDDFDAVVVFDLSRFTRSGIRHGFKTESDLLAVGIQLLSASDDGVPPELEDVFRSFKYAAAQEHAKSISRASTRGSMTAIEEGRAAYTRRPPYGIDKLYCKPDGTPLHIIRNLPDGRQLKLDPVSRETIQEFAANDSKGSRRHYIKQKDERVVLVPGAYECVNVVRDIYRWHFANGWGHYRIARGLNDKGVPSPTNRKWSTATVRSILANTIYTGVGIANRRTSAIYNMRAPQAPAPSPVDKKELQTRRHPRVHHRPREDWVERAEPQLDGLLDPSLHQMASDKQQEHLDRIATGRSPAPDRDRHRDSSFFLKGILRSKQGGHAMTGRKTGPKGKRRRYYGVNKAISTPAKGSPLAKLIPAEPIEEAVLTIARSILLDLPDLRERIDGEVRRQCAVRDEDRDDMAALREKKSKLETALCDTIGMLSEGGRESAEPAIRRLDAQIAEVSRRIEAAQETRAVLPDDIDAHVDAIIDDMHHLVESLDGLPVPQLRNLLATIVASLVVDLETREVELELTLPNGASQGILPLCLDGSSACKTTHEAQHADRLVLAQMRLVWDGKTRRYILDDVGDAA